MVLNRFIKEKYQLAHRERKSREAVQENSSGTCYSALKGRRD